MACSIKGNVKGNTSPATGRGADFLDFQPLCAGGHALCGTDLTSSLSSTAYLRCDDANRFAKLSKRSGCTVSTMVLSEALGLRLFRVIRGGIGFNTETGSRRHPAYRPSFYKGECSIKGNVKGNTSPATGRGADFLDFQPLCAGGHALCGTDLTSSLSSTAYLRCDDANRFAKLSKRSGCTVSTMVLSEALGLRLFRVIRGGIGFNTETGSRRHPAYRPSFYKGECQGKHFSRDRKGSRFP